MASHKKPIGNRHRKPAPVRRTRVLALTTAAGAAAVTGTLAPAAHAEPVAGPDQIAARIDEAYQQAEQATQQYDGTKDEIDTLQRQVTQLQDELARRTSEAEEARTRLGAVAAEQYRSGGFSAAMQLALSDDPQEFLERSARLGQAGQAEQEALRQFGRQQAAARDRAAEARARLADLAERQQRLAGQKAEVQRRLAETQTLLARLDPAQRAAVARASRSGARALLDTGTGIDALTATALDALVPVTDARAAQAIAFARAQLGKPYVWGATGPDSYDCSGLVQAAWRSAGVSLPRTTWSQIAAAPRVTRDQLQPGDLVFFFSGISHVGLYTGNGRMIHAPHPGAPVRYESIDVMPFAGAVRPA
ncbi:NlpC/P60 family protein [Kitasatospora sp. NPDC048365]|uniref:C40 family peptidase n=1 Tax=Kitasatospora sp. NPDC048365 TaxID=3364050 RepID=UPI00371DE6F1